MCGIFGYTGKKEAQGLVLQGLRQLEYRGYDSSGLAVQCGAEELRFEKTKGKIRNLEEVLKTNPLRGSTAIGHTRWATHGTPSQVNAHPHLDSANRIAVVHNGIIENYSRLKEKLKKEGVSFRSDTDTEVIVHLIAKYYRNNLEEAVRRAIKDIRGTYAVAVISAKEPGKIVAARFDSPLVAGVGLGENYLASDVSALLDHTRRVVFIENGEIVSLTENSMRLMDLEGRAVKRLPSKIDWNISQAKKGGFPHYMIKEIFEQPEIITAILRERIKKEKHRSAVFFEELKINRREFGKIKRVILIACGTAYHAGLVGKYILEAFTDIPVWVDTSSEFRYRNPNVDRRTLVIAISQSGETADTLAGLREAKSRGAVTLAICNVLGSSLSREARGVIYTHAGPEIAVASTKAYTAQLAVLYLLGLYLAGIFHARPRKKIQDTLKEFFRVPVLMKEVLENYKRDEKNWAKNAHDFNERYHAQLKKYFGGGAIEKKRSPNGFFLYLGRGINFPNALEGALKLKEISYIPAEGYPAGEMKHGPIALIDENPWVICLAPRSKTYDKMISNIQEIKARGGMIIPVVTRGDREIRKLDPFYSIEVPAVEEIFSPLLTVLPLQLVAYCVAREFGEDIDQPRNLAKSVTVE
ncbi:MAG: glutamine--fructose-6-phosphate transaminase (isomerizing) [Candidatus Omnitrophica bacterium]|nr:glutamine--fructose-6-phosphate transaminase (isomerizing) [Candidatus Omnitrophota bacterium]